MQKRLNDQNVISEGIKQMLVEFLFFEYIRNTPVTFTIGGPQKNEQANAEEAGLEESNIFQAYNQGLISYCSIQYYILENPESYDYENFLGEVKQEATFV